VPTGQAVPLGVVVTAVPLEGSVACARPLLLSTVIVPRLPAWENDAVWLLVEPLVKTSDATDAPLELRMKQPKGMLSAARVRLKFPPESAVATPATGGFPKVTHESW